MTLSVEGAGVLLFARADRRPLGKSLTGYQIAVRVQHALVDGDVRRQHGVYACLSAVHLLREPEEVIIRIQLIRAVHQWRFRTRSRRPKAQYTQAQGYRKYQYKQFLHVVPPV